MGRLVALLKRAVLQQIFFRVLPAVAYAPGPLARNVSLFVGHDSVLAERVQDESHLLDVFQLLDFVLVFLLRLWQGLSLIVILLVLQLLHFGVVLLLGCEVPVLAFTLIPEVVDCLVQ